MSQAAEIEADGAGRLRLDGRDVTGEPAEVRGFGMVWQGCALFPHMTVAENVAFGLRIKGRPAAEVRRRVSEMIELVGLVGHEAKRPAGLSGGQQQRVALARALAYEPPVLLLDEPFSALDRNLRGQMQDEMRRIHRSTGTTFVFVTHDQSEALALSSRVAIFEAGRLRQLDDPRTVYERPASRFVAEFLGDINVLPIGPDRATVEREAVALPAGAGSVLAIRPEAMAALSRRPEDANALPAVLTDLTYLGAETRLSLRTRGGTPILLRRPTGDLPPGLSQGAEMWVCWARGAGAVL